MKILIVDDSVDSLYLLSRFLERRMHVRPTTVLSGQMALETLRSSEFDVVICDFEMPAMNGFEVFEQMTAQGIATPFLLYTNMDFTKLPAFAGSTFLGVVRKPDMNIVLEHLARLNRS